MGWYEPIDLYNKKLYEFVRVYDYRAIYMQLCSKYENILFY